MSEIRPAIAAEHWPERLAAHARLGFAETWEDMHDAAALALYGQSFGFTWADVDAVRECAEAWRREQVDYADSMDAAPSDSPGYGRMLDLMGSLADRIAALLPPRKA
jgi:hypothetical protein